MRTLAIIPARGGSKGIPRKNLHLLLGKPLIAHTIETALAAKKIDRLIVSTDDAEIARVSQEYGADAPFLRPAELASDTASQVDVALHALRVLDESYDTIVLLQPTAPLRNSEDIDACIEMIESRSADSVVSFYKADHVHPFYMYTLDQGRPVPLLQGAPSRRQEFPDVYVRNGAIYAVHQEVLTTYRTFYGANLKAYIMPYERSINIDSQRDLALAEFFGRARL